MTKGRGRPRGKPRVRITITLDPEVLRVLRLVKAETGQNIGRQIDAMVKGKMKSKKKNPDQDQLNSDYQWLLMQSLSQYKGQWIAVSDKKIVARDNSLKQVIKIVSSLSLHNIPLYLRVPEGSITTLNRHG